MKSTPEHTCLHTVQIMDMAFKFAPSCDVLPDLAALVALRSRLVLDLAPLPPPMAAGSAAPPSGREGGHRAGYGGGERVDAHQRGGEGEGRHSTLLYGPPFKRQRARVAATATRDDCRWASWVHAAGGSPHAAWNSARHTARACRRRSLV